MSRAYGLVLARPGHHIADAQVALAALCVVSGIWLGVRPTLSVAVLAVVGTLLITRRHVLTVLVAIAALVGGAVRGDRDWAGAHLRHADAYTGWAQVVADPAAYGAGLRLTVEIDGERLDTWLYGARRNRPSQVQSGEYLWVHGDRRPMRSGARRAALRHVVGRFQADVVADVDPGSALTRASNRLRRRLRGAAEVAMPAADSALFTGLVLGDDAREPVWLVDDFRRSGLSHLTAVSGQNVGFLLLAAMPLLRRLRPWWR
ncbi:MAG: ComEC/Rec2 family competence protein, partial [Actinomycetota bacterium]